MRKILLLMILSVFTTLSSYGQCPDPPSVESNQYFCSASAWMLIGEGADYLSDLQIFPEQVGWSITWYADNAGVPGAVIANPSAELLVAGTSYHVTQTDAAACESGPTKISLEERDCACIKDPTFEDQKGNPTARGFQAKQFKGIANHKTCGQTMDGAAPYAFGTTNGVGPNDDAVFVTPGNDPPFTSQAGNPLGTVPIVRTNPNNPASSHGFRINRGVEYGTVITGLEKEFIAGEVFVFNFALIIQNPESHTPQTMPFGQVRLYDQNNNLVQERCLVSNKNDCIFNGPLNPGTSQVLYSDWSCMKMNTFDLIGQPLRAEFIVAYCTPTQHFSYMYLDDFYVGDDGEDICGDSSFGYAIVDQVNSLGGECFIPEPNQGTGSCAAAMIANVPGFPLQVCGSYDAPVSQGPPPVLDDIKLNIIQNDVVVGTLTSPSPGDGPNTFCFTINEIDINVLPFGDFTFELEVDFELDCGAAYNFFIDDRSMATVCPRAGCPDELRVCDVGGTGLSNFDLTVAETDLFNNMWDANDMTLTYYENELDAHDGINEILDPTDYNNSVPGGQIIYVRIDWTLTQMPSACYYLAQLPISINELPDLDHLPDEITVCDANFNITLSGVPDNLSELGDITYKWFKDGVQLASSSSFYTATSEGEYTVVVANFGCESSHTFIVELVEFSVDLGANTQVVCDGSPLTINGNVIPGPNTPPIDMNEVEFLWSTGETTQSITVTQSGTYTLDVTYEDCTMTQTKEVYIGDIEVDLGEDIVVCGAPVNHQLVPVVSGVPANEVTYLWSTGETSAAIMVSDFGTYSVDVTWRGCITTASISVTQGEAPEITLGETLTKCTDDEITLEVIYLDPVVGDVTYTWFLDGGQISGTDASLKVTDFGIYSVEVNNEGCISEAAVTVERYASNPSCIITKGISPEGSLGQNDRLDLFFLSSRTGIENIAIFNRYGRLVFEQSNYVDEWEGQTTDGDDLPTGVYYYVLNLKGEDIVFGNQTSGWIYINRGMN